LAAIHKTLFSGLEIELDVLSSGISLILSINIFFLVNTHASKQMKKRKNMTNEITGQMAM
jgi:preprotein translocase subunit YajC